MINVLFRKLRYSIKLIVFKVSWRRNNRHNYTTVSNIFPSEKVIVGKKTYGNLNIKTYGNPTEKLTIGNFCSIAGEVSFLLGGEHSYKGLSTYPFKKYVCGLKEDTLTKGPIIINDDVWIGQRCMILSGVTIGKGAVVAAGSIVTKDIPPYAIFAGGKIIKYRFSDDIIKKLIEFDYEKINEESIKRNIDLLYQELDNEMLDDDFLTSLYANLGKKDE